MNQPIVTTKQPATYQDVLDAPPNMVAELIRGALHLHPRPVPRHAWAGSSLGGELHNPFHRGRDGPGGWIILYEPELHLGDDVLVPDWAGWRRERMLRLPETAAFELAPDWVCELLSPGTRRFDVTEKRALYGAHGVGWLWYVDPQARTLEVFEARGGSWTLVAAIGEGDEVRVRPFEAIGFPLSALWPE